MAKSLQSAHSHDYEHPREVADEEHCHAADEDDGHVGLSRLRRRQQLPLRRRLGPVSQGCHVGRRRRVLVVLQITIVYLTTIIVKCVSAAALPG